MQLIRYDDASFDGEVIRTEATALELLTERPLQADVNYLAVPWSRIINGAAGDWSEHRERLRGLRLDGGFTICQHIRFGDILPVCQRIGLDVVFTPHVESDPARIPLSLRNRTRRLLRSLPRISLPRYLEVLPFPHLAVNGASPAEGAGKDIWYSFVGADTHPTRRILLRLPPRADTVLIERQQWHFAEDSSRQERACREYRELLARSRYSLCPRGTGASTVRFWESLQAGAIPVLLSDEMVLPAGIDWRTCVVRIREDEADGVERILHSISPAEEARRRAAALQAYECFSGSRFVECVRQHYDVRRAAAA